MTYPLLKFKYYRTLLKSFFLFIKNPDNKPDTDRSVKYIIYEMIGLYLMKMLLLIPVILTVGLIIEPKNVQSASMAERFSPLLFLLVGGFILPFFEEVAFRLSLKFRPLYLALSSSVFCYYILTKLVYGSKISLVDDSFLTRLLASLLFGILLYPLINFKKVKMVLVNFWESNFRIIYYVICISFAWIHISKYELTWLNLMLLPILTLPQLLSALIYGYIRIRHGFKYPLFFHTANNVIAIGLSLLPFNDLFSG